VRQQCHGCTASDGLPRLVNHRRLCLAVRRP
jgi:hypothetical protein